MNDLKEKEMLRLLEILDRHIDRLSTEAQILDLKVKDLRKMFQGNVCTICNDPDCWGNYTHHQNPEELYA